MHQIASWPLQAAVLVLIFASLAVNAFSSVMLVENYGRLGAIADGLKSTDDDVKSLEAVVRVRTGDRYRGTDADADFAKRDEQIKLLWKHIQRLERRTR